MFSSGLTIAETTLGEELCICTEFSCSLFFLSICKLVLTFFYDHMSVYQFVDLSSSILCIVTTLHFI